jgi:hypothetical protein
VFGNIVTAFLVPWLGNTNPSGDAKKRQQAFLVPLPGMDLKPPHLVIVLSNANRDILNWKPPIFVHQVRSLWEW